LCGGGGRISLIASKNRHENRNRNSLRRVRLNDNHESTHLTDECTPAHGEHFSLSPNNPNKIMSPAMFANRIRRFVVAPPAQSREPGFASLPGFARQNLAGPVDIYRLAYEQAQREVAARRERENTAYEWN
jgi:hypothetical protein